MDKKAPLYSRATKAKALAAMLGAALVASCSPSPAAAQDLGVSVLSGFVSRHAGSVAYNERNNGIGLRIDTGRLAGWAIGGYRNSINRDTVYIVREWQRPVAGPLAVGVAAGGATGYHKPIVPVVMPELVARFDVLEIALMVQPLHVEQTPAFVALQFRVRF